MRLSSPNKNQFNLQVKVQRGGNGTGLWIDGTRQSLNIEGFREKASNLHKMFRVTVPNKGLDGNGYDCLTKLCERNVIDSDFVKDLALLNAICEATAAGADVIVETDRAVLLGAIAKQFGVSSSVKFFGAVGLCFLYLTWVLGNLRAVLSWLIRVMLCKISGVTSSLSGRGGLSIDAELLLVSWASDSSLTGGQYKDPYFGEFSYVCAPFSSVKTIVFQYGTKSRIKALQMLLKQPNGTVVPAEAVIGFRGLLSAIRVFCIALQVYKDRAKNLDGGGFKYLTKHYRAFEIFSEPPIAFEVAKRLSNAAPNLKALGLLQENDRFEKAWLLGVAGQAVKTIGFFHTSFPNNLFHLVPFYRDEIGCQPWPDHIFFNSEHYLHEFRRRGLEVGAGGLINFKRQAKPSTGLKNTFLICLPGNIQGARYILNLFDWRKICDGASKQLLVRLHPVFSGKEKLVSELKGFHVSTSSLSEDLAKSSHVVTGYSHVAVEAAIGRCNVGLVFDPGEIELNPLDNLPLGSSVACLHTESSVLSFVGLPSAIKCGGEGSLTSATLDPGFGEKFCREYL